MRLRHILITTVATATVALASPAITPLIDIPSIAQADTRVSVSFNTFYEDLAPHGSWVSYHDSYVFVPARISREWRPYTVGHWVSTKRYGWMWVSDEPFGWATYHYGRWGYADDIGWYWIPGKRWAPAWVAWRRSNDHVVWAPLPPGDDDVSVEVRIEDIPDTYWVAVPSRSFLDADLAVVVVNDDSERVRVVEAAEPVGNVTIENSVVVNNVIDIDYVEKATEKKVETVEVKETDDPKQVGKGSVGEVAVFSGEVKEEKGAKPPEVKDVEEFKKDKTKTNETPQGEQPSSEPPATQGQDQTDQPASPSEDTEQTDKQKGTTEEPAQSDQAQPQQGQEQPMKKKQKAKGTEEPAQQQEAQPEESQGQPVKKKQQKAKGTEEPQQQQEAQPDEGQGQPVKKKQQKAKGTDEPAEQQEAQPQEGQQETIQKRKQRSKASGQPPQPEQGQEQPMQKQAPEEPAQGEQPSEPQGGCDQATGEGC